MNLSERSVTMSSGNSGGPIGRRCALARVDVVAVARGDRHDLGAGVDRVPLLDQRQELGLRDAIDLVETDDDRMLLRRVAERGHIVFGEALRRAPAAVGG